MVIGRSRLFGPETKPIRGYKFPSDGFAPLSDKLTRRTFL